MSQARRAPTQQQTQSAYPAAPAYPAHPQSYPPPGAYPYPPQASGYPPPHAQVPPQHHPYGPQGGPQPSYPPPYDPQAYPQAQYPRGYAQQQSQYPQQGHYPQQQSQYPQGQYPQQQYPQHPQASQYPQQQVPQAQYPQYAQQQQPYAPPPQQQQPQPYPQPQQPYYSQTALTQTAPVSTHVPKMRDERVHESGVHPADADDRTIVRPSFLDSAPVQRAATPSRDDTRAYGSPQHNDTVVAVSPFADPFAAARLKLRSDAPPAQTESRSQDETRIQHVDPATFGETGATTAASPAGYPQAPAPFAQQHAQTQHAQQPQPMVAAPVVMINGAPSTAPMAARPDARPQAPQASQAPHAQPAASPNAYAQKASPPSPQASHAHAQASAPAVSRAPTPTPGAAPVVSKGKPAKATAAASASAVSGGAGLSVGVHGVGSVDLSKLNKFAGRFGSPMAIVLFLGAVLIATAFDVLFLKLPIGGGIIARLWYLTTAVSFAGAGYGAALITRASKPLVFITGALFAIGYGAADIGLQSLLEGLSFRTAAFIAAQGVGIALICGIGAAIKGFQQRA